MKKEHVANCQFSVWYPLFKKHTIKSVILPLPQDVLDYLLDDGTLVVSGADDVTQRTRTNVSGSDEEEDAWWSDDEATATAPEFPEFKSTVLKAVRALGGRVFPKLNWSAPRDARWIALNGSLECRTLADIFLLLKSSDFVAHDLTQPFLRCSDRDGDDSPDPPVAYELVLRKWSELSAGGEFRCFVKANELVGISQRDHTQHYPYISEQRGLISQSVGEFFSRNVQHKFLDEEHFVLDVYRDSRGKVWLIDLNPFGEVTDPLLFTWEELASSGNLSAEVGGPVFRYVGSSKATVQPSPCLSYALPRDVVDLSTGEDAYKLVDFLKLQNGLQVDSDEEERE